MDWLHDDRHKTEGIQRYELLHQTTTITSGNHYNIQANRYWVLVLVINILVDNTNDISYFTLVLSIPLFVLSYKIFYHSMYTKIHGFSLFLK